MHVIVASAPVVGGGSGSAAAPAAMLYVCHTTAELRRIRWCEVAQTVISELRTSLLSQDISGGCKGASHRTF